MHDHGIKNCNFTQKINRSSKQQTKDRRISVAYRLWRPLLLLFVEETRVVDALDLCEYTLRWK